MVEERHRPRNVPEEVRRDHSNVVLKGSNHIRTLLGQLPQEKISYQGEQQRRKRAPLPDACPDTKPAEGAFCHCALAAVGSLRARSVSKRKSCESEGKAASKP